MDNEHYRMARLHQERATRHYEAGEIQEALQELTESYRFDPRDARTLHLLAEIYGAAGFLDPAVDFIQKSLREDYTNLTGWLMLANLYAQKGGPYLDLALDQIDLALGLDPAHSRLHYLRGNILAQKGELEPARAALQKALELDPEDIYARHDLQAISA